MSNTNVSEGTTTNPSGGYDPNPSGSNSASTLTFRSVLQQSATTSQDVILAGNLQFTDPTGTRDVFVNISAGALNGLLTYNGGAASNNWTLNTSVLSNAVSSFNSNVLNNSNATWTDDSANAVPTLGQMLINAGKAWNGSALGAIDYNLPYGLTNNFNVALSTVSNGVYVNQLASDASDAGVLVSNVLTLATGQDVSFIGEFAVTQTVVYTLSGLQNNTNSNVVQYVLQNGTSYTVSATEVDPAVAAGNTPKVYYKVHFKSV